jgi:hypothetical protein
VLRAASTGRSGTIAPGRFACLPVAASNTCYTCRATLIVLDAGLPVAPVTALPGAVSSRGDGVSHAATVRCPRVRRSSRRVRECTSCWDVAKQGRATLDDNQRRQIYYQIQQIHVDDAPRVGTARAY